MILNFDRACKLYKKKKIKKFHRSSKSFLTLTLEPKLYSQHPLPPSSFLTPLLSLYVEGRGEGGREVMGVI